MMKISLTTNLPDSIETLSDIKEIIKFATTKLDVQLSISEYSGKSELDIIATNNMLLRVILDEIEEEISNKG